MWLQKFIIFFIISEIVAILGCSTLSFASLEDEVIYIENEIEQDEIIDSRSSIYNGSEKGGGLDLLGAYQGLTYYSQADSRWANIPYTSIGDNNQTMKSSGCGPTTAAMVVSSSKGSILPTTMANLFVNKGFRTVANGTTWSAFPFIADYFDFNQYSNTSSLNTAINYLRKGFFVIVSCGNGLFTNSGHYILLVGINGNTLSIFDSYMYKGKFDILSRKGKVSVSGNTIYCTINNFEQYSNYKTFWCYSNDAGRIEENTASDFKYLPGSYMVTATRLRVRSGPGTNYRIVTTLNSGSKQGIDYVEGNWGHLMNGAGWICLDYCNKIEVSNNPPISNSVNQYQTGDYRTTANLHVRFGPSTKYRSKTYNQLTINARKQNKKLGNYYYNGYLKGVKCTVYKISGNWGLTNSGWICLDYCRKV